jgi:hypothetical protein
MGDEGIRRWCLFRFHLGQGEVRSDGYYAEAHRVGRVVVQVLVIIRKVVQGILILGWVLLLLRVIFLPSVHRGLVPIIQSVVSGGLFFEPYSLNSRPDSSLGRWTIMRVVALLSAGMASDFR